VCTTGRLLLSNVVKNFCLQLQLKRKNFGIAAVDVQCKVNPALLYCALQHIGQVNLVPQALDRAEQRILVGMVWDCQQ